MDSIPRIIRIQIMERIERLHIKETGPSSIVDSLLRRGGDICRIGDGEIPLTLPVQVYRPGLHIDGTPNNRRAFGVVPLGLKEHTKNIDLAILVRIADQGRRITPEHSTILDRRIKQVCTANCPFYVGVPTVSNHSDVVFQGERLPVFPRSDLDLVAFVVCCVCDGRQSRCDRFKIARAFFRDSDHARSRYGNPTPVDAIVVRKALVIGQIN